MTAPARQLGKRVGNALYLHASALCVAEPHVRERIEKADAASDHPPWNVAKVQATAVSLLLYESFDDAAFPALLAATRVNLEDGQTSKTDYRSRANPPILHRKETLLQPDDPRRPPFAAITRLAEEHNLFSEPHRIGTRKAWLERVEAAGLVVRGPKLRRLETSLVDVVRHRTAIARRDLSQPVQLLVNHRILTEIDTVLDYGCGQGDDVAALAANGFQAHGWDPHYAPDGLRRPADVVNLGFVLNVIEDRHERAETLTAAYRFARRALCVAVMPIGKYSFGALRPHGDGYLTARETFQKYFAQQELRDFIAETVGEAPVAFAPGIFVVFRDKDLEQEVLFRRQIRDITRHSGWHAPDRPRRAVNARPDLAERISAELQMLWAAIIDRGRILDIEEIPDALRERLRAANVSAARAIDLCLSVSLNRAGLAAAAAARKEDLLIHLALTLFPGAPRYTTLPRPMQRDLRAFFGSHAVAIQEANTLLFSVGKPEVVRHAVNAAVEGGLGGMRDVGTFRFYAPALNRLGAVLRVLVGCAGILRGGTEGADFIDIKLDGRRFTFLACKDATARLPICSERTRVDLTRLRVSVDQPDGMVLYLIGCFLPRDAPGAADQIAFDRKLVAAGIADEEGRGPRYAELNEILRLRRAKAGPIS
ncbi:DNA phosphorothioation-associated putative methyltransferase [Humitalea rosea]|nr:DNA phosphorothioation-associated putative methyltransferase [Humitalea rosea]